MYEITYNVRDKYDGQTIEYNKIAYTLSFHIEYIKAKLSDKNNNDNIEITSLVKLDGDPVYID